MTDGIFRILYVIGLIAGVLLRIPHFRRLRRQGVRPGFRAPEHMTPAEKLLAILAFTGIFVIPVTYIFAPWLSVANYRLPAWAGAVGVATFAAGLWLQWRGRADLGRNLTPTAITQEGQALVTHGAYRYIRHPVYAGHWLRAFAQPLLLHNWIAGLAGLVLLLPMYLYRVRREEQNMVARFGEEYRLYMDRTGRVFPPLRR